MIIAIDGPAGVGKSTIAQSLAMKLKFSYFDTGAMYRALTYAFIKNKIDLDNENQVLEFLKNNFDYQIKEEGKKRFYFVNNENITEIIRSNYISNAVSSIASKPYIRRTLVIWQRKYAEDKDIITEGRDMGTVVFPHADLKIYLTARASVRAERRFNELVEKFPQDIGTLNKNQILEDIKKRDELDSTRKAYTLRKEKDAHLIDTSNLSVDQIIKKILKKIKKIGKTKFMYKLVRFLSKVVLKLFYKFEVYGKENFIKGAAVVTSNHVSFFDPSVLVSAIEEEVHFLAKDTLFKVPVFNKIIKSLNAHPISFSSSNIQTFKIVNELLRKGKKIVIFPEGTRSEDGKLDKLLPGIAFIINLTKCNIIPTYIHGAYKVWGKNRKFPKLFGKIICIFGKPILFEPFAKIDKEKRIPYILAEVEKSLKNLQKLAEEKF